MCPRYSYILDRFVGDLRAEGRGRMSNRSTPTYLGDGLLLVCVTAGRSNLFCHNGIERTNAVYRSPTSWRGSLEYAKAIPVVMSHEHVPVPGARP